MTSRILLILHTGYVTKPFSPTKAFDVLNASAPLSYLKTQITLVFLSKLRKNEDLHYPKSTPFRNIKLSTPIIEYFQYDEHHVLLDRLIL